MKLSVVTTLYKSQEYIAEFCRRAEAVASKVTPDYEIVLVNDGSPDRSLQVAKRYADDHACVKVVDLSRNFGHHKAIMEGLRQAEGDFVFLLDSDLEEDPEWLSDFWQFLQKSDCDVVYGVQKKRRGGLFDRVSGGIYYRMFRALSGLPIPINSVTARLMSRRYVEALTRFEEREVDITGLWVIAGFEQMPYPVDKHSSSETSYTFRLKLGLFVDSITAFSSMPLVGIFYFGVAISTAAVLFIAYLLGNRFFLERPLEGWTSIMASIWLLGGLIISFVGVIGIYVAKIFSETKHRPNSIIREVYAPGRKAEGNRH